MHRLEARGIGRKFHRQWIFRKLDLDLHSGDRLLLTGPNGSGKSTLLRLLAGQLSPTEGSLRILAGEKEVDTEQYYRHIAWAGPYHELYTDLTLTESVRLHFSFRECLLPQPEAVMTHLQLDTHRNKDLRHFSSGMLHRLKIGLAIFTRSDFLFLDEATANLDAENAHLIFSLLETWTGTRGLLFASNQQDEWERFPRRVDLGAMR